MVYLLLLFISNVFSHSAPSCINKIDNITCVGFPRYYHFNHLSNPLPSSDLQYQFFSSRDRENILQPGVNIYCPELPLPKYTSSFPMTKAVAGSKITLQHPPRGHASQPSSPVWIYIYNKRNVYNENINKFTHLELDNFKLIGNYNYSNCFGLEKEISWANCTGTIKLPSNLKSGIYTFWWRWDLNSIPYYDCFDINIIRKDDNNKHKNSP